MIHIHHPDIEEYWRETFGEVFRTENSVYEDIGAVMFCAAKSKSFLKAMVDQDVIARRWLIISAPAKDDDWFYFLPALQKWYDEENMVRMLKLMAFI
jgi:hypothetical protein